MRIFSTLTALITALFFSISYSYASEADEAGKRFKTAYPNTPYESVTQTGIKGIYEVVSGANVFYFAPEGGYLLFGEIFKDGESITAKRKTELGARQLKDLPLDKAVKIGEGQNEIIEVADPDCPFCRKAHRFLKDRDDVTRYVFLYPLPIHPKAPAKAKHVLCSSDQAAALDEVLSGEWDSKEELIVPCGGKGEQLLQEHIKVAQKLGVRGTPAFWINGTPVKGANIPRIKELLGKGGDSK